MNGIKKIIFSNAFQIISQVLTVAGLILVLYITSRLAPLYQTDAVIITRVEALEKIDETQIDRGEFDQVVTRLNHISNRVDAIYNLLK